MRARAARLLAVLCVAVLAAAAVSGDRPAGLMWQTTGLPAVFPLIFHAPPGRDYYLTLHDPETGAAVLAAFATGGAPVRVLVPPGTYALQIVAGTGWQDETLLFGPQTERLETPDPLRFAVTGVATKAGHMVEVGADGAVQLAPVSLCRGYEITAAPRPLPPFDDEGFETRIPEPGELLRHPSAGFDPEKAAGLDAPVIPTDHAPYFSDPEVTLRERLCP
jgi:hypothetical protein